jgi:hypothetical protein
MTKNLGLINQRLMSYCPAYILTGPWQDLEVPADIRRLPDDPVAVISALQQEFSAAELQEAGVAVLGEDMDIHPNPALCVEGGMLVALRKTAEGNPFEVIAGQTILSGRTIPVCASLQDGRVRKMIKATKENVLFVAMTPADLAVLMSLGLPATLTTGLATLSHNSLEQFKKAIGINPPKPVYPGGPAYYEDEIGKERPINLLLVRCRLATLALEPPTVFADIASHLGDVEKYLDVPLDQVCVWRPPQETLKGFGFCMEHAGAKKAKAAILASVEQHAGQLIVQREQNNSSKSLAEAIETIEQLRSKPRRDPEDERRAWADVARILERESITPLRKAAKQSIDPIERGYLDLATMNGEILFPQLVRLMLKTRAQGKSNNPGGPVALPDAEFRQVMQMVDRQHKFLKSNADFLKNPFRRW